MIKTKIDGVNLIYPEFIKDRRGSLKNYINASNFTRTLEIRQGINIVPLVVLKNMS